MFAGFLSVPKDSSLYSLGEKKGEKNDTLLRDLSISLNWAACCHLKIIGFHVRLVVRVFFLVHVLYLVLSGNSAASKPLNPGSLTILGLHLTILPFTKMSLFTDKKEVQRSATALGYIAHVCSFSLLNINSSTLILYCLSGHQGFIYISDFDAYINTHTHIIITIFGIGNPRQLII